MPQPNALDLVRMILASGGEPQGFAGGGRVAMDPDVAALLQLAAAAGGSQDWFKTDPGSADRPPMNEGLDDRLPLLPPQHPIWRGYRERTDPPRDWRAAPSPMGGKGFADGGSVREPDGLPIGRGRLNLYAEGSSGMPTDFGARYSLPVGRGEMSVGVARDMMEKMLSNRERPRVELRGRIPFADGGPVDLLAQSPAPTPGGQDWYQQMYGPYAGTKTDAVDPGTGTGLPGWLGLLSWLNDQGPSSGFAGTGVAGAGAGPGTGPGSGPTSGVNSTSNSAAQAAVAAGLGAVSPAPGVVSGLSQIANMLANISTIGVPGVATVDVSTNNVNQDIAAIESQTANAVAAGIGTGNNAGQPGQANQPDQAPNVGPTPGIGMVQQTAQQATVGGGSAGSSQSAESPGDAAGNGSTGSTSGSGVGSGGGQSDNSLAKGGYLHHAKHNRPVSHRPIRRAALGHL